MSLAIATKGIICPGNSGLSLATKGIICITGSVTPVPVIPNIYRQHLNEELGEDGIFTEPAIFDPDGLAVELYGVFDDVDFSENIDLGFVEQKKDGPHFIVSEIDFDFDVYADMELYLSYRGLTFVIQEVDKDETGAQVLWLR